MRWFVHGQNVTRIFALMEKFDGVVCLFYKLIFFAYWRLTEFEVWFYILVFGKVVVYKQIVPWLRKINNVLEIVS
jgi:hypothetical protein